MAGMVVARSLEPPGEHRLEGLNYPEGGDGTGHGRGRGGDGLEGQMKGKTSIDQG